MLGAIAGDIIGSPFEGPGRQIKTIDFELFCERSRFTDDTVLTVAVAHAILTGLDYASALRLYGRRYPNAGYGGTFHSWIHSVDSEPYNSWGNGSAMRVSPVARAFSTVADVLAEAERSARVTHNHAEGIKGAQATALAVFLARSGESKEGIRRQIVERFSYDLDRALDHIRPTYTFDVSCQGSVPESIIAFLESEDFESAVRNAISLGGDSDTMACIAGAIAEAFYGGVPEPITAEVRARLPQELVVVVEQFQCKYGR
ncbi:MAG: ADP-ribosylglycohydrolase family protein [Gemmatimonadota bacterium]|nr:MAG: ADP-ribosylglycohydrolase family protein [Gemmatimonadota bacterium]